MTFAYLRYFGFVQICGEIMERILIPVVQSNVNDWSNGVLTQILLN